MHSIKDAAVAWLEGKTGHVVKIVQRTPSGQRRLIAAQIYEEGGLQPVREFCEFIDRHQYKESILRN